MIVLFLLFFGVYGSTGQLTPVVQTNLGPVQGFVDTNEDGTFYKYVGIPFASVEPLNTFGDPIPATPWTEVLQATVDGITCPQRSGSVARVGDCLILNVYVPYNIVNNTNLPVMVFTHGGGFTGGSSGQITFGPDKIVRHDVILVTHNYRVGPFGFMCFGNDDVPGNAGLKDTLLAYRWVQENIAAFGGNPDQVTGFGQSAGAFIVDFMQLYPLAQGLYHQVIVQSGTVLSRYLKNDYAINQENALKLAYELGYEGETFEGVVQFLSSIEPSRVIASAGAMDWQLAPCLENETSGETNYLTQKPYEIYLTGNYSKLPMMLGVTDNEGVMLTTPYRQRGDVHDFLKEFIDFYINSYAGDYTVNNPGEQAAVAEIIRKFYFDDGEMTEDEIDIFVSDVTFVLSSDRSLDMYLEKAEDPIYYFLFAYDGDRNLLKQRYEGVTYPGAAHGDELSYIFYQSFGDGITERDQLIMDRMTTMWTNFAKYSDPTPEISELLPIKWQPALPGARNYLKIDTELSTGLRPMNERMVFWELLRQTYGEPLRRGMVDFSSELNAHYSAYQLESALDNGSKPMYSKSFVFLILVSVQLLTYFAY